MPRTKRPSDLSEFMRGRIVGQHEGFLSQCKISENLSILLYTLNRIIVQFSNEGKECTKHHPVRPEPSERTLHLLKRNVKENSCCKASDIATQVDVSPRTAVRYLQKLGYYRRVVTKNHFFVLPI